MVKIAVNIAIRTVCVWTPVLASMAFSLSIVISTTNAEEMNSRDVLLAFEQNHARVLSLECSYVLKMGFERIVRPEMMGPGNDFTTRRLRKLKPEEKPDYLMGRECGITSRVQGSSRARSMSLRNNLAVRRTGSWRWTPGGNRQIRPMAQKTRRFKRHPKHRLRWLRQPCLQRKTALKDHHTWSFLRLLSLL